MYKASGSWMDFYSKTGSYSTHGRRNGRVDLIPPDAQKAFLEELELQEKTQRETAERRKRLFRMQNDLRKANEQIHGAVLAVAHNCAWTLPLIMRELRRHGSRVHATFVHIASAELQLQLKNKQNSIYIKVSDHLDSAILERKICRSIAKLDNGPKREKEKNYGLKSLEWLFSEDAA